MGKIKSRRDLVFASVVGGEIIADTFVATEAMGDSHFFIGGVFCFLIT